MQAEAWEDTVLANIVTGANGLQTGPFGGQLHAAEYTSDGIPVVMPKDLNGGRIVTDSIARIPEEVATRLARHRVTPGDILFGRRGDIGRCGLVADHEQGWLCGTGCLRARLDLGRSSPSFLIHLITWSPSVKWLTEHAVGQTMLNLSTSILGQLPLRLPPLGEQRKIAAILASVDDAIEATQAVVDQLQVVKKALMAELLTDGLPGRHTRFKQTEIGEVPEEWEVLPLDACIETGRPICYGILMPGTGHPGGVPVVKVKNIKNGVIDTTDLLLTSPDLDEQYARSRLRAGDVLLTIRGTTGRLARVPAALADANITQDTARLSIRGDLNGDYVFHVLQSDGAQRQIRDQTRGQAVKGINIGDVRKLLVPLPRVEEQNRIVDTLASFDDLDALNRSELAGLRVAKGALMSVLLTGEVRVTPAEAA